MSPTLTTTNSHRRSTVTVDRRPSTCVCGQDLDVATGRHCPRCGTQLGAAACDGSGFWFAV